MRIRSKLGILILCVGYFYFKFVYSNLMCEIIVHLSMWGYKLQIIFWFCFHFFDETSLTYSSNVFSIFSCSYDKVFWISPFAIHLHFHSFTVFNEEIHLLQHIFRSMSNSFSVFIFTRNVVTIMNENTRFVFICWRSKSFQV